MEVEVTSDVEKELLGRREVRCLFRSVYGHLSRSDAVQALSNKLKITNSAVYVISIDGGSGIRDAKVLFYIYANKEVAEKDLPKYIVKRNASPAAKPEALEEKKAEPEKPDDAKAQPKTTEEQAKPEEAKVEEVKAEPEETKP